MNKIINCSISTDTNLVPIRDISGKFTGVFDETNAPEMFVYLKIRRENLQEINQKVLNFFKELCDEGK